MASLGIHDKPRDSHVSVESDTPSAALTIEPDKIRIFRGRNVMGRFPALETWVTLGALNCRAGDRPGFVDRVRAWLPSLEITEDSHFSEVLPRVASALQTLAGMPDEFIFSAPTSLAGVYSVGFGFQEEQVARACFAEARRICLAAANDEPYDITATLTRLRSLAYEAWPGTLITAFVTAAQTRDIPVQWVNKSVKPNLLQLGWGARQRRVMTGRTDRTSYLAAALSNNLELTKELLQSVGVPVAEGRRVIDADEAWNTAIKLGLPVVVKAAGDDRSEVALNLKTRDEVVAAFERAKTVSIEVTVERFLSGSEYRLLVVGGNVIAAVRRDPPAVVGDGRSTIAELVNAVNEDLRPGASRPGTVPTGLGAQTPMRSPIDLTHSNARAALDEQGFACGSVPAAGQRVVIRKETDRRVGGTTTDVTELVHPSVAALMRDAARVVGLDIAGIDVIARDIARPLEVQGGGVLKVNFEPDLLTHVRPTYGKPRPVADAIIDLVFPPGETGRIPIVAITGTNGKTTTTRLIAHLVQRTGRVVGMTCTDGIFVADRCLEPGDCSGPGSAEQILRNPAVDVAVLETARGGLLRGGVAFDRCDVAVFTNIGEGDHLGFRGIDTVDELARVKRLVIEAVDPSGTVVLNADDPVVATMAVHSPGEPIWFSTDPDHPLVASHRARNGRSVFVRDAAIVLAEGACETTLVPLARVPMTHGGQIRFQVENALAGAAGAWGLGLAPDVIRAGLETFAGNSVQTPGRFNVFQAGRITVIVDYAHNTGALMALNEATRAFPHRRAFIVYAGSERRDDDVVRQGELLGARYDRIILYHNPDRHDRDYTGLNDLLRRGVASTRRPNTEVLEIAGEHAAIDSALRSLEPDDLLVISTEAVSKALELAQHHLALRQA
jgi:cyanophycin synthetase